VWPRQANPTRHYGRDPADKEAPMACTSADESLVVSGLADDLPITAAATTSRSLVDNDRVRVVAFSFDTGEQLTEHTASMPVVVQVIAGTMRFDVQGQSHQLRAGDCVYLPAKEPHSLEAMEPSRLSLVMIRSD
jgi:quercetin dioxygenase-like cupin family protein